MIDDQQLFYNRLLRCFVRQGNVPATGDRINMLRIRGALNVFVKSVMPLTLAALFTACTAPTARAPDPQPTAFDVSALPTEKVDKLLVVDCLLPGQVRKLGGSLTYVTPRRPIKTTALACEIRGGEYVAYDRADYATALKVWLPQAKEGDAEAQTYVGEIYEKGFGVQPDYALAAEWYRKAAEQNYARAQINLGFLYEKGLGVPQDLSEAMNWYRRASGLTTGQLEYVSTVEVGARAMKENELAALRGEVTRLTEEMKTLNERLDITQSHLGKARRDKKSLEEKLSDIQRRKQVLERQSGVPDAQRLQLEQELQQNKQQLVQQTIAIRDLEQESQQLRVKLNDTETRRIRETAAPSIEIIDPLLTAMRGVPSVRLRSIQKTTDITGKITAPAGVKIFKVNDRSEPVEKNGNFKVKVALSNPDTRVVISVVDNNNKQAAIEFMIQAAPGSSAASPLRPARSVIKSGDADFGTYYAIIIGNDNYLHLPKLRTAANDARQVNRVLREKYGFNTTLLIDADRRTILSTLYQLRERLTEKDNLLVYYAGHGDLDRANDRGYWLPVDAEPDNPSNWISNNAVTDIINTLASKHIFVVADSCYSGTLSRTSIPQVDVNLSDELRKQWLRLMTKSRSRTVLTSGGLEPVLDEGAEGHSVFAQAFVAALTNNHDIMQGYSLYRKVVDVVTQRAARLGVNQVPEYAPIKHAGHETGQFFFVPAG